MFYNRFNGLLNISFFVELLANKGKEGIEKVVMAHEQTAKYLDGKEPKKVIVVPKKIVNIVV